MSNKTRFAAAGLIAVLFITALVCVVRMNSKYEVIDGILSVKENAEELYGKNDLQGAIEKMEIYCLYASTDIEALVKLGDWYYESGDSEKAYESYLKAGQNKKLVDERIPSLSIKNKSEIILEPIKDAVIEITPDVRATKDMTLKISGHNIAPPERAEGRIYRLEEELEDKEGYYTTDWFAVDPDGEYLTMSGGFNCAVWQIKNAGGEITAFAESPNRYRRKDTYSVDTYQMARLKIPSDAAWCRVTYYDKSKEELSADMNEMLTIVYGRLPGESGAPDHSYYTIPDLKDGEKIVYKNETWYYVNADETTELTDWKTPSIERGSYFEIDGVLPGRVSFEQCQYADNDDGGIYTIRFNKDNPSATGQRMDDAKNLIFNSYVAQNHLALGENHFDNIYPWKDIRRCIINNGNVIAYEGDESFFADGRNGDVFVEIPKFYVKRTVDDKYDTISISGVCHDGFSVDEAFVTADGEADKIYVAAYLTSMDENNNARSIAGSNPVLSMNAVEIAQAAKNKGAGYSEMDYSVLSALQKLFMVETGMRNSQYLYMGICGYTSGYGEGENADCAVALTSNPKTNCLVVNSKYMFLEGNSVVIFNKANDNGVEDGEIRTVTTVIDNNDKTQSVFISGAPMNVEANNTLIAHTAVENDSAKNVGGHTGAMNTGRGTVAFKYRNIENLWGNAYVYIGGVRIKNGTAIFTDRAGNEKKLGYTLPRFYESEGDGIVESLGWDKDMPQVILPNKAGKKATTSTYYGDRYAGVYDEDEKVLYYGGGWSSNAGAGLFCFDASVDENKVKSDATGRMIFIK